ncbi:MAG: GIY-YIG nuclease family protein [Patescibacteria group bacterium]
MKRERTYYVYIMTNAVNTVLYTGVTNDLERRVFEHRNSGPSSFTGRYKVTKLVYFDTTTDVNAAIAEEKRIKAGSRAKKIALVESMNPEWKDLLDSSVVARSVEKIAMRRGNLPSEGEIASSDSQ